jgi:hypothetical protein
MVGVIFEFIEHRLEHALGVPTPEPVVNGLPRAESLRQIPPWRTGLRDVEDRVHERPVWQLARPAWPPRLCGQQVLNSLPLAVAQFMSVHRKLRSNF